MANYNNVFKELVRKEMLLRKKEVFGIDNKICISGILENCFEPFYKEKDEEFFKGYVEKIPVIVTKKELKEFCNRSKIGVSVYGKIYSEFHNGTLKTYIIAKKLEVCEDITKIEYPNIVYLEGIIMEKPLYKKTKKSVQFLLDVRRYEKPEKFDHIACVAFNEDAEYISNLRIGDKLEVIGKIKPEKTSKYEVFIGKIIK